MASRRVAGGPSEASDHRKIIARIFIDPGRGRGSNTRRREFPPRPLPRSEKSGAFVNPVVSRFARDHRLPYVTPSGVEAGPCENRDTHDDD
jgi:hypothetical protein